MRCGCPHCQAYMVQSDGEALACVCPECGYRCNACLGTGTVLSREALQALRDKDWFTPNFQSPADDAEAGQG